MDIVKAHFVGCALQGVLAASLPEDDEQDIIRKAYRIGRKMEEHYIEQARKERKDRENALGSDH